jgi:tetratricopeptide (TPR) repeat protein
MTRSSIRLPQPIFKLLRYYRPVWIGLCLALLGAPAVSARTPIPSDSNLSDAAKAYRLGMALVKDGRFDEAIPTFKDGLRTDPKNTLLLNLIGATYSLKGDSEHAQDYLLKSLQIEPGFASARRNLAISYFNSGKYDLAVPEFGRLMDGPGDSRSVACLFLGIIAEKQRDFSRSATLLGEAGDVSYQYPHALLAFAHSLFELNQPQKADAVLRRLDVLSGVEASEFFKAGLLYSKQSQSQQALAEFDRANTLDAKLPGLAYQRAVVLEQLGRSQEALKVLKDLTSIRPDADSLSLLADLAKRGGDLNLAIQSLRQAALLAPEKEETYLDFSTICMDHENYPPALAAVDIGLRHIPGSYRLQVQKGAILDKLGHLGDAETIVRSAIQLQEDNSVALLSLGIIQTHAGELEEAIRTFYSAIKKYPSDFQMYYYLGLALERTSESEAKVGEAFRSAIRLNPSFADSYYHLSRLYLTKDPKLAEENLLACLKLDPNHLSAEYSLGRLYLKTGRRTEGQALLDAFEHHQQAESRKDQNDPNLELAQR